jgi:adenylate kinase
MVRRGASGAPRFVSGAGVGMRLVLVGPPGSGKGTQAERLVSHHGLRYIGTGNILREAIRRKTPQGLRAEPYLKQGHLAPDELVNDLVRELFTGENRPTHFVADGYPRTVAQAVWFDKLLAGLGTGLDAVIQFDVSDEEVVRRISGRRVSQSGKVYHVQDRPPKVLGVCDVDGSPLVHRTDDREEVIRERLRVFHETTDALVEHYKAVGRLKVVPAVGTIDSIYTAMMAQLIPTTPT